MEISTKVRNLVFERDNWQCRACNSDQNVAPHHIEFRSELGSDDLSNLVTLCFNCHRKLHDGFMKMVKVNGNFFFGGRGRYLGR